MFSFLIDWGTMSSWTRYVFYFVEKSDRFQQESKRPLLVQNKDSLRLACVKEFVMLGSLLTNKC